ncbi:hypothetical protein SAMN04488544_2189 [Microlunatus sagamiharensis]|uniref:Pyrroline-5-carboxylate reductase catalytic N-terminal domain-containing protein n=1 Tax=Microlunatus sagamiharensis TaxID=546874 RepID=A0A1H2MK82_9ACTN|nr:NAD(P)-binding domain-containing protein [Microlunatus sagamiharensis]SDU93331.1 hypothetical protein SAMN04488544_2189 [Microlunatus sagamiharensis]
MAVVAVIGAGKLGGALARRALAAGHTVSVAGRTDGTAFRERVARTVPGARASSVEVALQGADLVVLALPLGEHRRLDPTLLASHVVVDAMNDWTTGPASGAGTAAEDSSLRVQRDLPGAHVVKAFNHIGYHDLDDEPLHGASPRRALAVAGDDRAAARRVADLVESLGFDAVDAGPLARGAGFAVGTPAFAAPRTATELGALLTSARRGLLVAA